MKILAIHLQSFLEYAQSRGLKPDQLIASSSIEEEDLSAAEATVSVEDFYLILEHMYQVLRDDHMGIRIGHFLRLQALGLIYQISLQATTIEEAIHYLKDFVMPACR